MRSTSSGRSSGCSAAAVAPSMIPGLLQLLEAEAYAREVQRPRWDFAVEIDSLRAAGLTNGDLRWLVCQGYLEHAVETTPAGSEARSFGKEGRLTFSPGSCFVLTEGGADSARKLAKRAKGRRGQNGVSAGGSGAGQAVRPEWDPERRVLRVGGQVVKHFRVPARNQELILTALQELGWPLYIDDPLPPVPGVNPKHRLRDTISRLNHNQQNRLIRFHGDGNGRGLWWELVGKAANRVPTSPR
jgi:hypothetical protein